MVVLRSPRQQQAQRQMGPIKVGYMLLIVFVLSLVLVLRQAWKVNQRLNVGTSVQDTVLMSSSSSSSSTTTTTTSSISVENSKKEAVVVVKETEDSLNNDFTDISSKEKLLSTAKTIMVQHGVVALQMLNEGYVSMTKSWICNAKSFPGVLDRTLFIATDQEAYDALTRWDGTLQVIHMNYTAPKDMSYGQSTYFSFMLFRTRLICHLLTNDITLWLIEADAVWLRDPSAEVLATPGDMVIMSDRGPPTQSLQGGFQLLRPNPSTRNVWTKLSTQFAERLEKFQAGDKEQIGQGYGTEQQLLDELIRTEPDHQVTWLYPLHFCPGLYYIDSAYAATIIEPKVILNNFIIGNGAKVERAKQNGHWFLKDDETCDTANAAKILVVA